MVELKDDQLVFSFPEVHEDAVLSIDFQRTLRIPDDGDTYPLPPGLGSFPLEHVDDHRANVSKKWIEHGGVMIPMYQSEALWLSFDGNYNKSRETSYPFAIKVGAGKIDAVTGESWTDALHKKPQDYLVSPKQPWLDGYCVEKDSIRQFVAMPLGAGYSAEEQLSGEATHGGMQLIVYPMKSAVYEELFPFKLKRQHSSPEIPYCMSESYAPIQCDMGLAPGGRMHQKIHEDPFDFSAWDDGNASRCFVHMANSLVWRSITGEEPPTVPFSSREYTDAGLPWFEHYSDAKALEGSKQLGGLKSIAEMGKIKGDVPLPENEPVDPQNIVKLGKNLVREGQF